MAVLADERRDDMHSERLEQLGLRNFIAGVPFNVRTNQPKSQFKQQIDQILQVANIQPAHFYSAGQVHGDTVQYADGVTGEAYTTGRFFPDTDGLITDKTGIALLIKYADCTPVVLFDPVRRVQAVVHSGWRSTVKRISAIALDKMVNDFHCDTANIVAFLGPTIDQSHYEVGPEVYDAFLDFKTRDSFFLPQGDKYLLSMAKANEVILLEAGIAQKNIEISPFSTFTTRELHSARRDGTNYQLNGIVTMMEHF